MSDLIDRAAAIDAVEDRGPTYLGDEWCDLYLGDTGSCVQWGDQQRRVWKIVG